MAKKSKGYFRPIPKVGRYGISNTFLMGLLQAIHQLSQEGAREGHDSSRDPDRLPTPDPHFRVERPWAWLRPSAPGVMVFYKHVQGRHNVERLAAILLILECRYVILPLW
jgi:hypothetical protein